MLYHRARAGWLIVSRDVRACGVALVILYVSHTRTTKSKRASKIVQQRRIGGRSSSAALRERGYASSQIPRQTPGKSLHSTVRISHCVAASKDPATEVLQVSSLASEIRLEDSVGSIGG